MADTVYNRPATAAGPLESEFSQHHPLVSWRSVLAGLLVSFLTLTILLSLGMAFGGVGLDDGTSLQNAGIFTEIGRAHV